MKNRKKNKKISNYNEYQRVKQEDIKEVDEEEEEDRMIKKRIYQKGFKISTMPSVRRPETIHNKQKPMVAKIDKEKQKKQM